MTSVQNKKAGATEEDRQQILRQMKVRTKLKTDKSWMKHQSYEEETDTMTSPRSPQLKSLEGRKSLWSPTPDSKPDSKPDAKPDAKPDRNSGTFTAKEVFINSAASPVNSSNKRFSYNFAENNSQPSAVSNASPPPSTASKTSPAVSTSPKPSPPPSTTGSKPATSYIIRGQTLNAVSQTKSPPSFNGYQKSVVQGRTNSLPRIQTATGFKMSTDEYKKLAPYNVRNRSADLSDDESPVTSEDQEKRTEQASSVLRNTTSKERAYVISAAKRNSGIVTQDSGAPFVAKRVEIQEEISPEKKSQSLPRSLANYLYEDGNRFENSWKEAQPKQTTAHASPPRSGSPLLTPYGGGIDGRRSPVRPDAGRTTKEESVTDGSSSPLLTSYGVGIDGRRSPVRPDAGKVSVVKEESKEISKPPSAESSTTTIRTTRTESKEVSKAPAERESPKITRTTRTERVTEASSESLPPSLESFLYEDANRYENSWKSNQSNPPAPLVASSRVSERPESPKLMTRSPEKRSSPIKPEPATITILRDESDIIAPKTAASQSSSRTVITNTVESDGADIPKLTSYRELTETSSSGMQTGPGKITVLKEERQPPKVTSQSSPSTSRRTVETRTESNTESYEIPKLVSCSISKTLSEEPTPILQTGPGKISLIQENGSPPKPVPRVETKPREKPGDLISWSDLDFDSRPISSGAAPKPVPRAINRESDKVSSEVPLIVSSPDLQSSNRTIPTPGPASISTVSETRYRVPEVLEEPEPRARHPTTSDQDNYNVRIKIETLPERPRTPETGRSVSPRSNDTPLVVSSPDLQNNRATQPPAPASISTVSETRYRVPEILDEPEHSPRSNRITSEENSNVRITIETLSERPTTPEPPKAERGGSPRPSPHSRESNTTTTINETRYRVPEVLEDTMLAASPARSGSRTTVTTTRTTDPVYTEYAEDRDSRSTRTISSSREKTTTTTTTTSMESRYDHGASYGGSDYDDPLSPSSKGVLFVKEYVNTSESLKSPTTAGNHPDFSGDSEILSYSTNSSYLYNSAPRRSDEGPCTYCGREIKDCAKIILEHLNIYCHEYCFKCGICNKPMGDLMDNLFIHRDVVHCESCYEKLF